MSRVEPIEKSSERPEERQSGRGRTSVERERRDSPSAGTTPGKAEGEERDIDQALRERDWSPSRRGTRSPRDQVAETSESRRLGDSHTSMPTLRISASAFDFVTTPGRMR